jgi:hypothetical protein
VPDVLVQPERRQVKRHAVQDSSTCFTASSGETAVGELRNLSILGLSMVTRQYFSVGTILKIHVPATMQPGENFLPAEVRHTSAQGDGSWLLGCVLLRFLTADEISAFHLDRAAS